MDPLLVLIAGYIPGAVLGFLAGVEAHAELQGKNWRQGLHDIWIQRTDTRADVEKPEIEEEGGEGMGEAL